MAQLVQVTQRVWEPDVKTLYVGRWRSVGRSPAMEIVIRPQGETAEVLTVAGSGTSEVREGGPARWSVSDRRIIIRYSRGTTYQGYINSEGDLILGIDNEPVTFQKVE